MEPRVSPGELYRTFGPNAFQPWLFYANEPALRFELSLCGPRVDLFTQAYDRAREIAEFVFRDTDRLVLVASWYGAWPPIRALGVFRSLRQCGIPLARPRACWTEPAGDGFEEPRTLVSFPVERAVLHRVLWGALAADLGITPQLECRVYLADPERGVLLHPYDDRGMDVIGPNRELLSLLFHRFRHYLLAYDLRRMEGFFAPGGPA